MRRQSITPCQIAVVWDWMPRMTYTDGDGAIRRIPSAWIMLYARIWTLTQGATYYGIRAVDLGAWAGLRDKKSIQDNLNQMVAAGILRKAPAGNQGCGYCAVVQNVRGKWHIDVEGWMVTDLGLRGAAEILVYALVYSFRRGGCWMAPKRIAACVGCTDRYASKVLARLQAGSELHGGQPLIVRDANGRRRPNADVYRQYVRAANEAIQAAAGDIWDQMQQRRREGHRSVERQYRQTMESIVRDIIQGGGEDHGQSNV